MNLVEFADMVMQDIDIKYYNNQEGRYCCIFHCGEISEGIALHSTFGNGNTPIKAMNNYSKAISGKKIIFHAMSDTLRKEYMVPNLEYMKE